MSKPPFSFTDTPVEDFINDPEGFMDTHIVRALCFDANGSGSDRQLTLKRADNRTGFKTIGGKKHPCQVLELKKAGQGDTVLVADYCHYYPGEFHQHTVGLNSKYVFTVRMDGCTFGVSGGGPGQACVVSHANLKGGGSNENNHHNQRSLTRGILGADVDILNPGDYMTDAGVKCTTFGVKNNMKDEWNFFYQTYKQIDMNNYEHLMLNNY